MQTRSVYVHAPFCARRCNYCDFAVHVQREGDVGAWLEAIGGEFRALLEEGWLVPADRLDTLYVGGGTPSHLGPRAMAGLRDIIGPHRLEASGLEWTAEANPESFTEELAGAWREAGVNRLSFGVQSFQPEVLRWMGRLHGAEGAVEAVERARDAGFDNFSIDLIFGLPERLERDWASDLERALELDPPHVSLYGLTVESGTPLARAVEEGREVPIEEEPYRDEYLLAVERLTAAGYVHYEVSNFARSRDLVSRHNSVYWGGEPYLGLGNGAHSYAPPERRWNLREWEAYRERAGAGVVPSEETERLDAPAQRLERIWLGLRTNGGLPLEETDGWLPGAAAGLFERWADQGLATVDGDRVRLTAAGWLVMDRLSVDLDRLTGDSGSSEFSG